MRPQSRAAVGLCGGLPLQELPVRHGHSPQRRHYRSQRDPGLVRQQPQADEGLHDSAAHTGQYACVAAQPDPAAALHAALGKGEEKPCQKSQQRRPCSHAQAASGGEKPCGDRRKSCGRNKAAAQIVDQPPAVNVAQSAAEYKGEILPVAAYPAVLPLVVGQRTGREAVGKLCVAHICAAQTGPLRGVMAENTARWKAAGAFEQRGRVYDAFSRKAAAVKGVHVQLAAQAAVWVASSGAGEYQGEVGLGGAGQLCVYARVDDRVPCRHDIRVRVDDRGAQRVQHCTDKLPG